MTHVGWKSVHKSIENELNRVDAEWKEAQTKHDWKAADRCEKEHARVSRMLKDHLLKMPPEGSS